MGVGMAMTMAFTILPPTFSFSLRASASSSSAGSPINCNDALVYVGTMPLRAPPGPARLVFTSAHHLGFQHLQHFFTVLQPASGGPCLAFDFQPSNPEDPFVALTALSGGAIPGIVLERKLLKLPSRKCWRVGSIIAGVGIQDVVQFNEQWDNQLQLWKHDCRHHTDALVEFLTGEKDIVQKLNHLSNRSRTF